MNTYKNNFKNLQDKLSLKIEEKFNKLAIESLSGICTVYVYEPEVPKVLLEQEKKGAYM
ncbi:cyclic lactone autoinducer peptide [Listeria sp. SHR_NRA_18]|uniref:AgrD family cyclic lactone autoinducer peptide n=1 Tax=Listeria TaxID=1637 RepID=UPI00098E793A|nr:MULTISPECIES: cyclic lactone autoinducer peptide [Listeria]RQW65843.1 cyclic lactone autoinducer peptide [Listeria sp. SHR_NRA_18]